MDAEKGGWGGKTKKKEGEKGKRESDKWRAKLTSGEKKIGKVGKGIKE